MRSTADHQFISTDVDELDALLCAGYEQFFGTSVRPGSRRPDSWSTSGNRHIRRYIRRRACCRGIRPRRFLHRKGVRQRTGNKFLRR